MSIVVLKVLEWWSTLKVLVSIYVHLGSSALVGLHKIDIPTLEWHPPLVPGPLHFQCRFHLIVFLLFYSRVAFLSSVTEKRKEN